MTIGQVESACVEAIILCRLRKLVCTVSCCGAMKGAQCRRADAELAAIAFSTIIILWYVTAVPISP